MSETAKHRGLPDLSEMLAVTKQFEIARVTDATLKDADLGELIRLVPEKHAIVGGVFQGRRAVFRMCLDPSSDMIAREWAELQRLWPQMQSGRFRIAEPLHVSTDNRIIVVEYVSGTPLLNHLKKNASDDHAGFWRPVSRWLRHATESTETWRPERYSGWLTRAGRAASSQPFAELKVVEAAILKELGRIGELFQGTDWRTAICHGDYHPNNLIVDGQRLTAVDTGGSSQLPIYKDMARFLVHLARRGITPSGEHYLGVDRHGIAAFAATFDLSHSEEHLILPFMIGCEVLLRVETKALSANRIKQALAMSEALLGDLRLVSRL